MFGSKPFLAANLLSAAIVLFALPQCGAAMEGSAPTAVAQYIEQTCLDCHEGDAGEAGLDLASLAFDLQQRENFARWVLIHDRVRDGEMPPPDDRPTRRVPVGWSTSYAGDRSASEEAKSDDQAFLRELGQTLADADRRRVDAQGRAKVRRMNRFEYENTLRHLLSAPWLQVADSLPEDGVDHWFNKVGERLDVSYVQMSRYLEAAELAVRLAIDAAAHPTELRKFYAREEPSMQNYLHYRFGQTAATRSIMPLLGLTPEPDVIRKRQPVSVGDSDPLGREQEAMGVFSGTYSATTKYDFSRVDAPTAGRYRLRFKTYTFRAGPNGASGGDDHGLTGGRRAWWRPDRNVALPGTRTEPITLYALSESGSSRWLTTFDSTPEPSVLETFVTLRRGEGIRPDAARLVRTRPGWKGNPNAQRDGVPGFAMNWLEVEGPLHKQWPPASYQAIFGDLPFTVVDGRVAATPEQPEQDARRLLTSFYQRALSSASTEDAQVEPYVGVYERAVELGNDFSDAVALAVSAMLCAPELLYFDARPGPLSEHALQQRLAYFLWNGPPEPGSARAGSMDASSRLRCQVDSMLDDPRSRRFIDAFLDYWLDLRDINANTPDAELYPDYYLDELLTESSVLETRLFFQELIRDDLPARNLVDADFAFLNERLAQHYGLLSEPGVQLRRTALPEGSPRGGLLTQSSVLRVTANGTTTSPVVRGAWIARRILGVDVPDPPSGVDAVEPDIRGAKTIRQQLQQHRSSDSCNACHARFDHVGFALESFDVTGGWRDRYRAIGGAGEPVEGLGKNGHAFTFTLAQPVDGSGQLRDGREFEDVRELKQHLLADERQLARNLLHQLIVYATGAPITFGDRREIEAMLDRAEASQYGVRTLIHEVVQSQMFQNK